MTEEPENDYMGDSPIMLAFLAGLALLMVGLGAFCIAYLYLRTVMILGG